MEVCGTVLQRVSNIYGAGTDILSFPRRLVSGGSVDVGGDGARYNGRVRGVRVSLRARSDSGFSDNGHIKYYQASTPRCGGRDKQKGSAVLTTKKKMKLLKGLSMAPELGFSLDMEKLNFLEEVQGKPTSDAAEVLLKQLEQLKAEEKEMKRLKKEEKAKVKAARMKTAPDCESSSSSSSESSDSDCEEEIVDMCSLRASTALAPAIADQLHSPVQEVAVLSLPSSLSQGSTTNENLCDLGANHAKEIFIDTTISSINVGPKFDDIATPLHLKRGLKSAWVTSAKSQEPLHCFKNLRGLWAMMLLL